MTNSNHTQQHLSLHDQIIAQIEELLPANQNKVEFIASLLGISTNSAYRRLVGTTQFSLKEASLISSHLNFSLDNLLLGRKLRKKALFEINDLQDNNNDVCLKKMEQYIQIFQGEQVCEHAEYMLATNSLPIGLSVKSELLYKFKLYKWLYATGRVKPTLPLSELQLSNELQLAQQQYDRVYSNCKKGTLIIDEFFYSSTVSKIQFFHAHGLVTDEERSMLMEELLESIDGLELAASQGAFEDDVFLDIYVSPLKIETTYVYVLLDDQPFSFFPGYSINLFKTMDAGICEIQENWLKSLMRYSSSITQSNEVLRFQYFERQRDIVHTLDQNSKLALIL